jgi:two-component system phosphate regulon sensor histidine kinase PhoR
MQAIPREQLLSFLQLVHELRSPINVILNCLDVVLQGYTASDPDLQDDLLTRARDRAANMLAQVDDFLRLGSVSYGEMLQRRQRVQLLDIVDRLEQEMRVRARWRSVDLELDLPDSLPPVWARPEDMEHLLSNLLNNAIKYTHPGGQVRLVLREEPGVVVGAIRDTGIGIPPDDLPHIFDEFYRARNAKESGALGTGLGLSITKRIVGLYDGALSVESVEGKGSTFTFSLPTSDAT